jgi:glutamate racemase
MKIGVFDSGIGGLTVLKVLQTACPGHSLVYLGDTARVPYGIKSRDTVIRYGRQVSRFLLDLGVDLMVIACNTASAFSLSSLKETLPIPVFGVIEPGAQNALKSTRNRHVGIIATQSTIRSRAYEEVFKKMAPDVVTHSIACPLFVPLIEEGLENSDIADLAVRRYLADWLPGNVDRPDTIVLGCTHYPLLRDMLSRLLGDEVRLIDSAAAVAEQVSDHLKSCSPESRPACHLYVTDASENFDRTAQRILGNHDEMKLEVVDLLTLPFGFPAAEIQ